MMGKKMKMKKKVKRRKKLKKIIYYLLETMKMSEIKFNLIIYNMLYL